MAPMSIPRLLISLALCSLLAREAVGGGAFTIEPGDGVPAAIRPHLAPGGTLVLLVSPKSPLSLEAMKAAERDIARPLSGKPVGVVAVAVGDEAAARRLKADSGASFHVIADPDRALFSGLATGGVPRAIVVDAGGRAVALHGGFWPGAQAQWRAPLEQLARGGRVVPKPAGRPDENLGAIDIRGKRKPETPVETWITDDPGSLEGKYVLYDYWATWCGPCVQALDTAEGLHARFEGRLVTIAISDEDPQAVRAFVKKKGWKQPIGVDTSRAIPEALEIRGIPHAFLVNPEGIVVWQGHPMELWQNDGRGMAMQLGGESARMEK